MLYDKEKDKEHLLTEYNLLREEILTSIRNGKELFNYTLVSFAALLTIAKDHPKLPEIYTIIIFILLIITIRRINMNRNNLFIATYMRLFLEPYLNIKWETNLYKIRTTIKKDSLKLFLKELGREQVLFSILAVFIMIFSFYENIFKDHLKLFIVNVIICLLVLLLNIRNNQYNKKDIEKIESEFKELFNSDNNSGVVKK